VIAREGLRADCARCAGLCCVVPGYRASADFAFDKAPRTPCPNLAEDFRCGVHGRLRERGFAGCTVYDCFGAGQHVVQVTFGGRSWREGSATTMFDAYQVARGLHELLWYLCEGLEHPAAQRFWPELADQSDRLERLLALDGPGLAAVDAEVERRTLDPLLLRVSGVVRAAAADDGPDLRGADLVGRDLRRRSLRGADLRASLLIGSDLRRVDLTGADLIGADLRGADLRGADLSGALFVTAFQVAAARGDAGTRLAPVLLRPAAWD
jgi:uncharacterized protein YjbI with pentapeptide repeats